MLLDPAVVALENIYRNRFEQGMDARTAALEGCREIGIPVLTAPLTTVCVFIPITFVTDSGYALWMKDFAITLCISVIASLCVAFTLVPLAVSRAFQRQESLFDRGIKIGLLARLIGAISYLIHNAGSHATLRVSGRENLNWFSGGLSTPPPSPWLSSASWPASSPFSTFAGEKSASKSSMREPSTVALACIVVGSDYYLSTQVGKRPFRWQPARQVAFNVEVPRSYTLKDGLALFERVNNILLPRKVELNIDAISSQYRTTGTKRIVLYLGSAEEGELSVDQVKRKIKALRPADIPGVRFKSDRSWVGRASKSKGRTPTCWRSWPKAPSNMKTK